MVECEVNPQATQSSSGPDSSPVGPEVEPECVGEQDEAAGNTIVAFSGFFSGLATAVEQRVRESVWSCIYANP